MGKFEHIELFSKGDGASRAWDNFLEHLEEGNEIVSAVSDEYCIHYILKKKPDVGKMQFKKSTDYIKSQPIPLPDDFDLKNLTTKASKPYLNQCLGCTDVTTSDPDQICASCWNKGVRPKEETKIEDYWAGGDPDDVNGYLVDYLQGKFTIEGEPLDDKDLEMNAHDANFALEVFTNIRNAIRAKNEDFDE